MSPTTRALLDAHIEAIRRWHAAKIGIDRGEESVLRTQGLMRASAAAFAVADAEERRTSKNV